MSKHVWKQKQPVVGEAHPHKVVPTPPDTIKRPSGTPRWLFSRIDLDGCADGLFGWHCLNADGMLDLLKKIQNLERTTWHSLEARHNNQGSHFLTVEKLSKEALERVEAQRMHKETDRIYSLRAEGAYRIIGLRYADDFFVVWFDPDHKFCPSRKK